MDPATLYNLTVETFLLIFKGFYLLFVSQLSLRYSLLRFDHVLQVFIRHQRAKKVVSDSLGPVDFAIGLVNSVFNLPDGQVMFFEEFE